LRAGDYLGRLLPSICDDIIIELIVVAAVMIAFVLFVRW
jgi:hypothetical protein